MADMKIIAENGITFIRTYSQGNQNDGNWTVVRSATKVGVKVALGVWIDSNPAVTNAMIDEALGQVAEHPYTVVQLVIGNEVNRQDDKHYTPQQVADAMAYARSQRARNNKVPPSLPITSCFSGTVLMDAPGQWKSVIQACEKVVFLTVYPWYGNSAANNIDNSMQWSWNNGLAQVEALGKQIVIGEIGWPSAGGRDTTVENEATNYAVTKKWMSGANSLNKAFDAYWFEMFDEPWKTKEGSWGPHWGLCDSSGNPKFRF
jgi:exo-beta-1,3-glucanase (GH17 family)